MPLEATTSSPGRPGCQLPARSDLILRGPSACMKSQAPNLATQPPCIPDVSSSPSGARTDSRKRQFARQLLAIRLGARSNPRGTLLLLTSTKGLDIIAYLDEFGLYEDRQNSEPEGLGILFLLPQTGDLKASPLTLLQPSLQQTIPKLDVAIPFSKQNLEAMWGGGVGMNADQGSGRREWRGTQPQDDICSCPKLGFHMRLCGTKSTFHHPDGKRGKKLGVEIKVLKLRMGWWPQGASSAPRKFLSSIKCGLQRTEWEPHGLDREPLL
ncbi:hypothetical protein BKA83DRAFT_4130714 [Pisolithus microcarpus]|nr:hypothetical protein BKA83DRAFT_4130714 [Pisolithus microcarpus]